MSDRFEVAGEDDDAADVVFLDELFDDGRNFGAVEATDKMLGNGGHVKVVS